MTVPKVIFIDWYKTASTSLFWTDHPGAVLNSDQLARTTRYVFSQPSLIADWMRGVITSEQVVSIVAKTLQLDANAIQRELQYSCEAMKFHDPEVINQVHHIKEKGIKVVLATDNMDSFERWTVPALKLNDVFDEIITSVSRGALKADMQAGQSLFFSKYLSQKSIAAANTMLIDDTPIETTTTLGMGFRQVTEPGQLQTILKTFI